MSYQRDFIKIYNKIDSIAKKGKDAVFDFYILVDEIIDNGQYGTFQDVLINKYKIDSKTFKSVQDFKYKSFPLIRYYTNSVTQRDFKKLFDSKNVYPVGFHFFNKTNNQYLGDIKEVEQLEGYIYYKDPKLVEKEDEDRIINLEVVIGLSQSILESIPPFDKKQQKIIFASSSQVIYQNNIYQCTQDYTYTNINRITPTYSEYWTQKIAPTYSLTLIEDDVIKLYDKYSSAIDIINNVTYRDV